MWLWDKSVVTVVKALNWREQRERWDLLLSRGSVILPTHWGWGACRSHAFHRQAVQNMKM